MQCVKALKSQCFDDSINFFCTAVHHCLFYFTSDHLYIHNLCVLAGSSSWKQCMLYA